MTSEAVEAAEVMVVGSVEAVEEPVTEALAVVGDEEESAAKARGTRARKSVWKYIVRLDIGMCVE